MVNPIGGIAFQVKIHQRSLNAVDVESYGGTILGKLLIEMGKIKR